MIALARTVRCGSALGKLGGEYRRRSGPVEADRVVCLGFVTQATAEALCHFAFHEKDDLLLDPHSGARMPIWNRCILLYAHTVREHCGDQCGA